MTASAPCVSIVMSVLNGESFLREALDSILNQTFRDWELVVINNASTDGTAAILASYDDPRIVCLRNNSVLSLPASLNIGIKIARAPLIARLDADDLALPERLSLQVQFMEAHPEVALLGTWWNMFWVGDDGQPIIRPAPETPTEHEELVERLASTNPMGHPTLIYRRDAVRAVGCYDESFVFAQDWALVIEISRRFRLACLPLRLTHWRIHPAQLSSKPSWKRVRLEDMVILHRRALAHPELSPRGRKAGLRALGGCYMRLSLSVLRQGELFKAVRIILCGIVTVPARIWFDILWTYGQRACTRRSP